MIAASASELRNSHFSNPLPQLVSIDLIVLPHKQKSDAATKLIRREKKSCRNRVACRNGVDTISNEEDMAERCVGTTGVSSPPALGPTRLEPDVERAMATRQSSLTCSSGSSLSCSFRLTAASCSRRRTAPPRIATDSPPASCRQEQECLQI